MYSFWHAVAATPWWLYVSFYFFIRLGLLATKPRILTTNHLFIAPLILLSLYMLSMYYFLSWQIRYISIFSVLALLGMIIGWLQFKILRIKAIRGSRQLYLPGTWSFLIIVCAAIVIKYYYNIGMQIDPFFFQHDKYASIIVMSFGLFTGMTTGRLIYATKCIQFGPYHESKKVESL